MRRFLFRLALQMGRTVRELAKAMGSDELSEWAAYYQLEPFGPMADDWRHGIACDIAAKAAGAKQSKSRHYMLSKAAKPRKQSLDEMAAVFAGIARQTVKP